MEPLKSEMLREWIVEAQENQLDVLLDCLMPWPASYSRVGGSWDALRDARAQPAAAVSYAKKLSKEEAQLDWSESAQQLDRKIRAFNPWPVAETRFQDQQLRIWQAQVISMKHDAVPGTVLAATTTGIQVACGSDVLNITQVQQAGRKTLNAAEFIKSHTLTGVQLGASTGKHS